MTPLRISNRQARHLWLWSCGLSHTPTGPLDLMAVIENLGFVQIDTIRNVTRAHHHILWSRNQNYREPMLWSALADQRALFEHFTHDASLLPISFYPMWQRQFRRLGEKTARHEWYQSGLNASELQAIRDRIIDEGPLSSNDFDTKITGERQMWSRPPHKKALDQMWYAGELTTSYRLNFNKYYDFSHRVIPAPYRAQEISDSDQINRLCQSALDRLSFATPGEIQRFWAAMDAKETKIWVSNAQKDLCPVSFQTSDGGWIDTLAPPDIETRLKNLPVPSSRLRLLNPFDPAIRDRQRLMRLFGFDYRNEMFVPKSKRIWGYYVYPLLEGDRFVGRMELKANREESTLTVTGIWSEPKVMWTPKRRAKLDAELARFARLAGLASIGWATPTP